MGAQGLGYYKDTPVVTPVVVRGREYGGPGLAVIGDGAACRLVSGGDNDRRKFHNGDRKHTPVVM